MVEVDRNRAYGKRESLGLGAHIERNLPFMGQEFNLLLTMLSL